MSNSKSQEPQKKKEHVYDFLTVEDEDQLIKLVHEAAKCHLKYQIYMGKILKFFKEKMNTVEDEEDKKKFANFIDRLDGLIDRIPDPYGILVIAGEGRLPFEAIIVDDWPEIDEEEE